jgi:hypothetical protein
MRGDRMKPIWFAVITPHPNRLLKNEFTQVVGASLLAKILEFASPASWLLHSEFPKPSFFNNLLTLLLSGEGINKIEE